MNNNQTKGRGALTNPDCRYHAQQREAVDDAESYFDDDAPRLKTTLQRETARSIISKNNSPDVPFEYSINPYRGCEHGCVYCFARPTHAYLDLSPGLDFESRLFVKHNAAELLRRELGKPKYVCKPIALGMNTDAYQPVEREYRLTRRLLEVLYEYRHPLVLITKSALIERDMDILSELAKEQLVKVMISMTTLDKTIARNMEPRASTPARRLTTISRLAEAGIPTGVLLAPVIPVLTDPEMENILEQCKSHGASSAGYVMLRLPLELAPLFEQWLQEYYPLKASHVLTRVRDTRNGKLYESRFGERMHGRGAFAEIIGRRFEVASHRFGLTGNSLTLKTELFRQNRPKTAQLALF